MERKAKSRGKIFRSAHARIDLIAIWEYIATDNPNTATKFIKLLIDRCQIYVDLPNAGRKRSELGDNLYSFPFGRYVIVYQPVRDGIVLTRVLHSARDIKELF